MSLKSYTFRLHSPIILKDFHHRPRVKPIQMFDSILGVRQKLRESVYAFVQISKRAQLKLKEIAIKRLTVVL